MAQRTVGAGRRSLGRFSCALAASLIFGVGCNKLLQNKSDESEESDDGEKSVVVGSEKTSEPKPIEGVVEKTFTGTWRTGWGPLVIEQNGSLLTGSYSGKFRGTIKGEVKGNEAKVDWLQTNGERGKALFKLSADGNSFKGTWGGFSSRTNGGSWNGKRSD